MMGICGLVFVSRPGAAVPAGGAAGGAAGIGGGHCPPGHLHRVQGAHEDPL